MTRVRTSTGEEISQSAARAVREWTPNLSTIERRGRAFIDERPLMALMLAVAGGYCLGRMLSRV